MNKKIFIKLAAIFSILIFIAFLINIPADATFEEEEKVSRETTVEVENAQDNYVIYKYDRKANETTIVNLEEMLSLCNLTHSTETKGYTPNKLDVLSSNYDNRYSPLTNKNFWFSPNLSITPYSDTCKIIADGGLAKGSGYLVGSNLLLTCAHCVFSDKTFNNFYSNWTCYPAYDNGPYSDGLFTGWDTVYYSSDYGSSSESESNENDWALCVLQSDLGNSQGWFGCRSYGSNSSLDDAAITTIGYPDNENFSGKYQYYTLGNISNVHSKWFDTDTINRQGMSGGPVALQSDNYAVGIIKGYYEDSSTYAVRITSDIVDLINSLQ